MPIAGPHAGPHPGSIVRAFGDARPQFMFMRLKHSESGEEHGGRVRSDGSFRIRSVPAVPQEQRFAMRMRVSRDSSSLPLMSVGLLQHQDS